MSNQTTQTDDVSNSPAKQILKYIDDKKGEISGACSGGVSFQSLRAAFCTAMMRNPDVVQCDLNSIILACMNAAKVGLDPNGLHNSAYFEVRNNKQKNGTYLKQLQLQIGYGGLIELVKRSGDVVDIKAEVVYEGERIEVLGGSTGQITHCIDFEIRNTSSAEKIIGAYCIITYKDGTTHIEVLSKEEMERSKEMSRAAQKGFGPWIKHRAAMWMKSVIRKACKYMVLDRIGKEALDIVDQADGFDFDFDAPKTTAQRTQGDSIVADALLDDPPPTIDTTATEIPDRAESIEENKIPFDTADIGSRMDQELMKSKRKE